MTEWKRICCAVDFGEPSRLAMEHAAELARRFGAELTLVHVAGAPPPAASNVLVSSRTVTRVRAREDEETLARWRAELEARAGLPVGARALAGDAAEEILRHAREEACDLVVVGTHGRTGLPRLVMGSVSERVARRSACPVLVVHDHQAREREDVAEEAAQYR